MIWKSAGELRKKHPSENTKLIQDDGIDDGIDTTVLQTRRCLKLVITVQATQPPKSNNIILKANYCIHSWMKRADINHLFQS